MKCADYRDVLTEGPGAWQLPAAWAHRSRCPQCRTWAEGFQQIRQGLQGQPAHTPPPGLRMRLLTMVGDIEAAPATDQVATPSDRPAPPPSAGSRRLALRRTALGLAVGLVLGIALYPVVRRVQEWVAAGEEAVLRPEPLPATKQAGDLAVTLTALKPAREDPTGEHPYALEGGNLGASWRGRLDTDGQRGPGVEAVLELKQAGTPTDEWTLTQATVADAKGHAVTDAARQQQWAQDGRQFVWLEGPLGASVWCVTLGFQPSVSYTGFASHESWTVKDLPIPGPTAPVLAVGRAADVQGVSLELLGLVPPGRATYTDGVLTAFEAVPYEGGNGLSWATESHPQRAIVQTSSLSAVVRAGNWTPDKCLSVRGVDDRGRAFEQSGSASGAAGEGIMLSVMGLKVPPDAKTLDLTFTVQKVRTVEFIVRPPTAHRPPPG